MQIYVKKNLILFFIILALAGVFWSSIYLQNNFRQAVGVLENYIQAHQVLGIGVFIGLAALSAMFSPFSSVPLVPAATIIWGNVDSFIFLLSGWVFGGVLTYSIGYSLGRPIFRHFVAFGKISNYSKKLPEHIKFALVFLFRLALPAEIPGYVLGILRYNFPRYLLATLLAELPFAYLGVNIGYGFQSERPGVFLFSGLAIIFILGLAFYLFHRQLSRK